MMAGVTATTRLGSDTGRGRKSSTSAMLKLAEVSPIPIASEPTATSVNPGFLRNIRTAWRSDRSMGLLSWHLYKLRHLYRQVFHHAGALKIPAFVPVRGADLGSTVRVRDSLF